MAAAFQTSIHHYFSAGQMHRANAADPEIPEALAEVSRESRRFTTFIAARRSPR